VQLSFRLGDGIERVATVIWPADDRVGDVLTGKAARDAVPRIG
jgi:hypothetical protein